MKSYIQMCRRWTPKKKKKKSKKFEHSSIFLFYSKIKISGRAFSSFDFFVVTL